LSKLVVKKDTHLLSQIATFSTGEWRVLNQLPSLANRNVDIRVASSHIFYMSFIYFRSISYLIHTVRSPYFSNVVQILQRSCIPSFPFAELVPLNNHIVVYLYIQKANILEYQIEVYFLVKNTIVRNHYH